MGRLTDLVREGDNSRLEVGPIVGPAELSRKSPNGLKDLDAEFGGGDLPFKVRRW